ncbi:hypothetical protein EXU30_02125 [Shewanella maritima]|uniref:Uncharacterized protein n=1 Tax=Shewanella maritima TaxID=2520507 RepID=A0A411PDJ1_9GAMM|nr:hypothetical protein [Shewanella maritima]QBF81623.1 hypothetical protein EXU30_02125 [Shewanella maritima]
MFFHVEPECKPYSAFRVKHVTLTLLKVTLGCVSFGLHASTNEVDAYEERLAQLEAENAQISKRLLRLEQLVDGLNTHTGNKVEMLDLVQLVKLYSLPSHAQSNVQDWRIGANNPAINWQSDGIDWQDSASEYSAVRKAEVIVTIDGKPIEVLKKRLQPHAWSLTLNGARAGVSSVVIDANINSPYLEGESLLRQFDKAGVDYTLLQCDELNAATFADRVYRYQAKALKTGWMRYEYSCGSGGCSQRIELLYQKPKDGDFAELSSVACPKSK